MERRRLSCLSFNLVFASHHLFSIYVKFPLASVNSTSKLHLFSISTNSTSKLLPFSISTNSTSKLLPFSVSTNCISELHHFFHSLLHFHKRPSTPVSKLHLFSMNSISKLHPVSLSISVRQLHLISIYINSTSKLHLLSISTSVRQLRLRASSLLPLHQLHPYLSPSSSELQHQLRSSSGSFHQREWVAVLHNLHPILSTFHRLD